MHRPTQAATHVHTQGLKSIKRWKKNRNKCSVGTSRAYLQMILAILILILLFSIGVPSQQSSYDPFRLAVEDPIQKASIPTVNKYEHSNSPSHKRFGQCTSDQMNKINARLKFDNKKCRYLKKNTKCPENSWIDDFDFKGEGPEDDDTNSFLGISIGCNKGYDAIKTARMGMSNVDFDSKSWASALKGGGGTGACNQKHLNVDSVVTKPARKGEMHCVEPMPSTFKIISEASSSLGLESKGFILTHAAISASNGSIKFPNVKGGVENLGLDSCKAKTLSKLCEDVPMYSLQTYVEKFVKGSGPINILQIDAEGFDFDILFGAGSVLDRTQYLEFEYHQSGTWANLHINDAVRLLDGKGFNCYWTGKKQLWRITDCYFDSMCRAWSNVACVHRSQTGGLVEKMENIFLDTLLH